MIVEENAVGRRKNESEARVAASYSIFRDDHRVLHEEICRTTLKCCPTDVVPRVSGAESTSCYMHIGIENFNIILIPVGSRLGGISLLLLVLKNWY